jgi:hypothetical protein
VIDLQEQLKNIYFRVQKGMITEEGFVAQVEAAYTGTKLDLGPIVLAEDIDRRSACIGYSLQP